MAPRHLALECSGRHGGALRGGVDRHAGEAAAGGVTALAPVPSHRQTRASDWLEAAMGHEGKLKRAAVSLSLPTELVERARACTDDLSGTVEKLLARHVDREELRLRVERERRAPLYDGLNRLSREHGSVADELSPL
jgi:post-segregation antitoxin (ccd killing protein)